MKILMRLIKKYPLISLIPKVNRARIIKVSLSLLASLLICHSYTARAVDISDDPLETRVESAPTLLMFVLDNSGSMDWEFLTDNTDGKFEGNIEYLFDDPGDNNYSTSSSNGTILSTSDRGKWKSQWSGYNKIYYNPDTDYLPWPQTTNNPFANADTTTPQSNPVNDSPTFDLSAEFHLIQNSVIVDNVAGPNFEISPEPGAWALSTGNQWGEYYHWVIDDLGNHWAKWTPDLEFAGEYEVYVYTNNNSDLRRTDVSYTIKHDGNETLYCCHNQKDSDPGWYLLDKYYFAADGSDEYVQT